MASSALASVVLPVEVLPATRMLRRSATAWRSISACAAVMMPAATWSCSVKTATAGLRIAKAGAATTGGSRPSNRSPVSGNSAETRGFRRRLRRQHAGGRGARCAHRRRPRPARACRIGLPRAGRSRASVVGVEHHLDYAGVSKETGDGKAECGPRHAGSAKYRLRFLGRDCHVVPFFAGPRQAVPGSGMLKRTGDRPAATGCFACRAVAYKERAIGGIGEYLSCRNQ